MSPATDINRASGSKPLFPTNANSIDSGNNQNTLLRAVIGDCWCAPTFHHSDARGGISCGGLSTQIVELEGIKYIGLGAVVDELSPRERVFDTLEQSTTRAERLISVGYLVDPEFTQLSRNYPASVGVETIPLDLWNENFPNRRNMSKAVLQMVERVQKGEHSMLLEDLVRDLKLQKSNLQKGNNRYMAGITAHNVGVVMVLAGRELEAEKYFEQAISLKQDAFGENHEEVALSFGELAILLFARGDFEGALNAFSEAYQRHDSSNYNRSAIFLNNIGCCSFQMGNYQSALSTLLEARECKLRAVRSSAKADLDLLHVALVMCNCGYLTVALKQYDEARALFEEALLIQQSVLDDNHRAIRDTLSNLAITNAFQF